MTRRPRLPSDDGAGDVDAWAGGNRKSHASVPPRVELTAILQYARHRGRRKILAADCDVRDPLGRQSEIARQSSEEVRRDLSEVERREVRQGCVVPGEIRVDGPADRRPQVLAVIVVDLKRHVDRTDALRACLEAVRELVERKELALLHV